MRAEHAPACSCHSPRLQPQLQPHAAAHLQVVSLCVGGRQLVHEARQHRRVGAGHARLELAVAVEEEERLRLALVLLGRLQLAALLRS